MEIHTIYKAVDSGRLYHIISKQTKNSKTYIKFKRHHSVFEFIFTPAKSGAETDKYVLLKDKEKARTGTLRVMWQDVVEKELDKEEE